jgi:hypothetical protein
MRPGRGQPGGVGTHTWREFARQLWATEFRGASCWFCGHHIVRGLGEIEHRISPSLRPELAWKIFFSGEPFLVPVHGGGKRRCPEPGCDLDCNAIAGGNAAPRDELGRSAKWSPEFLERKQAERRTYRAREGRSSVARRAALGLDKSAWMRPASASRVADPVGKSPPQRRVYADAGRQWLLCVASAENSGNYAP